FRQSLCACLSVGTPGDVFGRLRYLFKTAWRDGTTHAIFEPLRFLEKLAALVPTPRAHLVRFHGLLGPAAKWRPSIVPNNATRAARWTPQPQPPQPRSAGILRIATRGRNPRMPPNGMGVTMRGLN
ncbi:MAG: hypothetical protein DMG16_29270, partial [Acidobacteria bacterium]